MSKICRLRRIIKGIRRFWIWISPFLKYVFFAILAFITLLTVPSLETWLKVQSPYMGRKISDLENSVLAGQIEGISIIVATIAFLYESRKHSNYQAQQVIDSARSGTSYARIQALEELSRASQSLRGLEVESSANLQGINLTAADLRNAILIDTNLSEARLWEANLQEVNLSGSNLTKANLVGANLLDAVLESSTLTWAKLRDANMQGVNLSFANLKGADLRGANLQQAVFQGAELEGTKFAGADLKGANFQNVDFIDLEEIQLAHNWQDESTRYSEAFSVKLNLRSK